ncbi:chaperonin 10-like protein [Aspergillus minisclerotigenes]|uniref:Chaperonin 10-like protein n=1 Tax=Aspergillus minisclerotigenes TaxID=656917 RepID=A0A5N6IVR7_9EURO|nr:chaperonin 10-like protein [Aspergillus minisclerotigenes]
MLLIFRARYRSSVSIVGRRCADGKRDNGARRRPAHPESHSRCAHQQVQACRDPKAEQLGTLEGLAWCETEVTEPTIEENHVEIEIMAVGVNFKDVAVTMGIVPDNEKSLSYECTGVVWRLGPVVKEFLVGDRVCMMKQGSHANRIRVHVDRSHVIPDPMSYKDAATTPWVYLTSLYAFANNSALQSVLVHSATGGIGHVKPIHSVTTYGFREVSSALALIRNGCHIGKVVITNNDRELIVPTRLAIRRVRLSPVVSHLIVGSLKGLCSTLAVHIAQYGARRIVVSNRNRISDEASAEIVRDCMSYGCRVTEAEDDIGNMNFVKGLVQNTFPRIGGIAQAAMALNDMSYESMTQEQYKTTI